MKWEGVFGMDAQTCAAMLYWPASVTLRLTSQRAIHSNR